VRNGLPGARIESAMAPESQLTLNKYPLGRWLPFRVEGFLVSKIGWYLFVFASK